MNRKPPKLPRDPNQRAKAVLDLATMDEAERAEFQKKFRRKNAKPKPQTPGKRGSTTGTGK